MKEMLPDALGEAATPSSDELTVAPAAVESTGAAAQSQSPNMPELILRFVVSERLLHWAIALPFLGCLTSAMVLVAVYNPDPSRSYRLFFATMHRTCGFLLFLCPSLVLLFSGRHLRMHLYNIGQGWLWTFDDFKWLVMMGLSMISKRFVLPDQGKFNAAEKLNFMMVMTFSPLFVISGAAIWFPDFHSFDTFAPWMFHCALAALATPLLCGHMFMATINPDTRVGLTGMITGYVSREWASHHYARWFREHFPHLAHQVTHEVAAETVEVAVAAVPQEPAPEPYWLPVSEIAASELNVRELLPLASEFEFEPALRFEMLAFADSEAQLSGDHDMTERAAA